MKKVMLVVVLALAAGTIWMHFAASSKETWIVIQSEGEERAAFVPRLKPYTEGGPSVTVPILNNRNVRTKEGLVVTGFEFIGWKEASTNRVLVFALVPRQDVPNTYMPGGEYMPGGGDKNLRRQDFATLTVGIGQAQPVEEMKTLGIKPMVLRAEIRKSDSR